MMYKIRQKKDKQKITFFLVVKQVKQDCFLSIYTPNSLTDTSATFPSISEEVYLPLPEQLLQTLAQWQAAYKSYYGKTTLKLPTSLENSNIADPNQGLSIRRKEIKKTTKTNKELFLREAESSLKKLFLVWINSQTAFPIQSFIRRKIRHQENLSEDSNISYQSTDIDILIDCQGENSQQLRQLPWSSWKIITSGLQEEKIAIQILQTTKPIQPKIVYHARSKSRILIFIGDDPYLNLDEIKNIAQKLVKNPAISLTFIEARNYPSRSEYLEQVRLALVDNRCWDALFVISHGGEGDNGMQLRFSSEIQFSIAEITQELLISKDNGLRLVLLNCCSGHSLAEFLIRNGIHQVYAFSEKINHQSLKLIFLIFIKELLNNQSIKTIHKRILNSLEREALEFPSLALVPKLFQYPDPEIIDFQIKVAPLKHAWQVIKPQGKSEVFTMAAILLLSMTWPTQDLLTDVRLFMQAIARTAIISLNQSQPPTPQIQLISIDQKTINKQRQENYPNLEERPIDRRLLADIIDNLNKLDAQVIGINYLLANQTEYGTTLINSINDIQSSESILERPWMVFVSDFRYQENPNQAFFNSQKSIVVDGSFILWELGQPDTLQCDRLCSFPFRLVQAYQLRQTLDSETIESINIAFDDRSQSSLEDNLNNHYFEAALSPYNQANQINNTFDIQLFNDSNTTWWQLLWMKVKQAIAPHSLIDYSQPPSFIYEKMSAQDFLDQASEATLSETFKNKFKNHIVIITAGDYLEVEQNNASLPLATQYWCSHYINQRIIQAAQSQCERNLTAGEIHAYRISHYLNKYNLRQVSFFWIVILGIITAKLLRYLSEFILITDKRKFQHDLYLLLAFLNILNIIIFMVLKISIPLSVALGIIVYYVQRDLKESQDIEAQ